MLVYSVVGFPMSGGWATFHREYKRRKNAEKQQKKLAVSGNFKSVMLRQEEVLIDKENTYISIDSPLYLLERDASGKIKEENMQIYIVCGGCVDDYHIIAVYRSLKKAEKRVELENKECKGLNAYIEIYEISK